MFRSIKDIAHEAVMVAAQDFSDLSQTEINAETLAELQAAHADLGQELAKLAQIATR